MNQKQRQQLINSIQGLRGNLTYFKKNSIANKHNRHKPSRYRKAEIDVFH